jgi:hypothetical protein
VTLVATTTGRLQVGPQLHAVAGVTMAPRRRLFAA